MAIPSRQKKRKKREGVGVMGGGGREGCQKLIGWGGRKKNTGKKNPLQRRKTGNRVEPSAAQRE